MSMKEFLFHKSLFSTNVESSAEIYVVTCGAPSNSRTVWAFFYPPRPSCDRFSNLPWELPFIDCFCQSHKRASGSLVDWCSHYITLSQDYGCSPVRWKIRKHPMKIKITMNGIWDKHTINQSMRFEFLMIRNRLISLMYRTSDEENSSVMICNPTFLKISKQERFLNNQLLNFQEVRSIEHPAEEKLICNSILF